MNKYCDIAFAVILAVAAGSSPATAGIKFDIAHTSNKAMETLSGWQEQGQKLFEESTTIQTMISYGKGVAETGKMIKEQKDMVTSTVKDTAGAVNSVKETATSTINEATGEVSGLTGEAANAAGGSVAGIAGEASAAASKTKSAQELLALKNERAALESEYETGAAARKTEFEGQIKSYQDNNAAYQKMITEDPSQKETLESKIISNNEVVRFLTEQFDKREAEEKAKSDAKIAEVDSRITAIRDKTAAESMGLASDAAGAFKSLFGNKQSAEELNKTIANNFIPIKEEVNSANIKKVMTYRSKTAAADVMKAYADALQIRVSRYDDSESADDLASKVPQMQGSSAAIAMDTQVKVKNMKVLLLYAQSMIAEMKMRSAMDLASLKVYQLRDPNKDVTQFNLDDYKYKKPSKVTKDNIMGLARDAAEKANTVAKKSKEDEKSIMSEKDQMLQDAENLSNNIYAR